MHCNYSEQLSGKGSVFVNPRIEHAPMFQCNDKS